MVSPIEFESPHYSKKEDGTPVLTKKTAIVIHDTGGHTTESTLNWFLDVNSKVSSHYLIGRDGGLFRIVPDEYVAWHAGKSSLHGVENVNSFAFGIELVDDNDAEAYPEAQLEALFEVCAELCIEHRIPLNRVVGHSHICVPVGRKVDPGRDFLWYEFLTTLGARIAEKELIE
jgi:N-acetylmuramoyl-L-alanine amidase